MYHLIVQHVLRRAFDNISKGNFEAVLAQCSPTVRHRFAGNHAFGGERNDSEMLRRWFQRVSTVFPNLRLEITDLFVKGMPWDTRASVFWTEYADLHTGETYINHGVHHVQLRWGRVTSLNIYLDTQLATNILDTLGASGVAEAIALPIVGVSQPMLHQ